MRSPLLILLVPVYILCTGCPPEEPSGPCYLTENFTDRIVDDKFEYLYKKFVHDTTGTAWHDTIFTSPYPDSLAERRRLYLKRCTDSCFEIAESASQRLCEPSREFDDREQKKIRGTPFPWRLFRSKDPNPYTAESDSIYNGLYRAVDDAFIVAMDTTVIL